MDTSIEIDPQTLSHFEAFKAAKMELVSAAAGPVDVANQVVVTGKKGQASMPIYNPGDLVGIVATLKRVTGKARQIVLLTDAWSAAADSTTGPSPQERVESGDEQASEALIALITDGEKFVSLSWPYRYDAEGFIVDNGPVVTKLVNGGDLAKALLSCF